MILGAGPTGLGAATRLQQLGHTNWTLVDRNDYTGGLATSFIDEKGFTWDIGGHVIFSHYQYFNDLIDAGSVAYAQKFAKAAYGLNESLEHLSRVENLWCQHQRESWIRWQGNKWLPYPFQTSFYLSDDLKTTQECIGRSAQHLQERAQATRQLSRRARLALRRRPLESLYESVQLQGVGLSSQGDEPPLDR